MELSKTRKKGKRERKTSRSVGRSAPDKVEGGRRERATSEFSGEENQALWDETRTRISIKEPRV